MTPKQFVTAYKRDGSIKAVAKVNSITYHEARSAYLEAKEQGLIQPLRVGRKANDEVVTPVEPRIAGQRKAKLTPMATLPKKGKVKRYFCTSAQNNTFLHDELYANLLAFAEHMDAELLISRFAYQRSGLNRGGDKAEWAPTYEDQRISLSTEDTHKNPETLYGSDRYVWAEEVYKYVSDERLELAPGLVWCGEWQRNPTTVNPLSGFQVYTGQKSAIFPHVKLCMESVPTSKHEPAKFNYTTGTLTMRNYIQKGAGLKAEFHHCLHPDTEFLTKDGLRSLRETSGQVVQVWSGAQWEEAKIKSFGEQQLFEIEMAPVHKDGRVRTKYRRTVRATSEHTWHLTNGTITNMLEEGDTVLGSKLPEIDEMSSKFLAGVKHGLVFGDGTECYRAVDGLYSFQLPLHGDRAGKWKHLFDNITSWRSRSHIANYGGTAYCKSYRNYKVVPPSGMNPSYIAGFLHGWTHADAVFRPYGSVELASIDAEALEWAAAHAPYAGWTVTGFHKYSAMETNYGKRTRPLNRLTLSSKQINWRVTRIVRSTTEEVMCAVVEPSHKFTLAGGILTGNCYGALLVEVDSDGDWFCRQLSADSDGTFYDLDVKVSGGKVTTGHRIEGLTLGDIHEEKKDPTVHQLQAALHDALDPRNTFYHDIINFGPRNHHDRKDPFKKFKRHVEGKEDVRAEISDAMSYLARQADHWPDTKHVVVDSNHDRALERWLRESDWQHDPLNMMFYMESVHAKLASIAEGEDDFHMLRHWWLEHDSSEVEIYGNVQFLDEDESYVICDDPHGGIECGMHGHLGANGGRGNIRSFAKMGRRANIGHSHTAGIVEGIWQAGTSSLMDLEYNKGMSSWSHSHILTYANGKRCMITMRNGKYRAGMKSLTDKQYRLAA